MDITHLRRREPIESQNTLRTQRQQIEKLKHDSNRLKEDLALETRQAKQANNVSASAQISKLQDQGEMYGRKIEREKARIAMLNQKIEQAQAQLAAIRQASGGNQAYEQNLKSQRKIRQLENELDKALVKLSEAKSYNKRLQQDIDNLRIDRQTHEMQQQKLIRDLAMKAKKIEQIVADTKLADRDRDEARREMLALKAAADEQQRKFEKEWEELKQSIFADRMRKDYIQQQTNQRFLNSSIGSETGRGSPSYNEETERAMQEVRMLKEKVRRGTEEIAKDMAQINEATANVVKYEQAFSRIHNDTNTPDTNKLVQAFIESEDKSFAMFNQVNRLSTEVERLEDSIKALNQELLKYTDEGLNKDSERRKILDDLNKQLETTQRKVRQCEERYAKSMQVVNKLKEEIKTMHDALGCLEGPDALSPSNITESNMMQYLGAIEERAAQLLAEYNQQSKSHGKKEHKDRDQDLYPAGRVIHATLPHNGYGAEDDDEGEEEEAAGEAGGLLENHHEATREANGYAVGEHGF